MKHLCNLCGKNTDATCFNCDIMKKKSCYICGDKLKICEECKNIFICSFECYKEKFNEYKNNIFGNHLCQMYACKKHFNNN
jgi:hypothetical protein